MSAIAAISLVTLTKGAFDYIPMGETNGIAKWNDMSGEIPLGYSKLTMSNRPVGSGNKNLAGRHKVKLLMEIPVLTQPSGPSASGFTPSPVVGHVLRGTVEMDFSDLSTDEQRNLLLEQITAAMKNAQYTDLVWHLGQPY